MANATPLRGRFWWTPYLYLLRVQILTALLLILLPPFALSSTLLNGLFDLDYANAWVSAFGMLLELAGNGLGIDYRVAPLVERDPLGEELGAQAVRLAFDRIDTEGPAHALARTGRSGRRSPLQRPCVCRVTSSAKTVSPLPTNRAAPSG